MKLGLSMYNQHVSGRWNAAKFECNFLSDMTTEEKKSMRGYISKDPSQRSKLYHGDKRKNRGKDGRKLVTDAVTVDHHADGHMFPVKDQGTCGSCYAFAANTALEGYVAKKQNKAPVHYSEQHLVDCTLRKNSHNKSLFDGKDYGCWGCGGGYSDCCWKL